jgi:hypothetical protein
MTTAELVNLILDKLRTGRVTFHSIAGIIDFEYGYQRYEAFFNEDNKITVVRPYSPLIGLIDNYSRHIEGILNGHVRNEEGELVIDNHDA